MNRELPVRPGRPTPGWVRLVVVGTLSALATIAFGLTAGAPSTGDHSPEVSVTRTMPGA